MNKICCLFSSFWFVSVVCSLLSAFRFSFPFISLLYFSCPLPSHLMVYCLYKMCSHDCCSNVRKCHKGVTEMLPISQFFVVIFAPKLHIPSHFLLAIDISILCTQDADSDCTHLFMCWIELSLLIAISRSWLLLESDFCSSFCTISSAPLPQKVWLHNRLHSLTSRLISIFCCQFADLLAFLLVTLDLVVLVPSIQCNSCNCHLITFLE